jgi:GntR family transcriptional regulator, arabinose operon transcriptional repressor
MKEPKYIQLKQEIQSWLVSGRFMKEGRIPSEKEIAEQFHISRHTVRHAIGMLDKEGLLHRVRGKGTFVTQLTRRNKIGTKIIGFLTTNILNDTFPSTIKGVEKTLRNNGYTLLLSSTDDDKNKEEQQLKKLISQQVSGLIIEPTKASLENRNLGLYLSLMNQNIPYLMINERYSELNCPSLKVDDNEGGFIAAQHLIQLGHRRIAGFFKTDDLQGLNRLKGFIRAHSLYDIPLNSKQVISYASYDKNLKVIESVKSMLQKMEDRPTAIVCYNVKLAIKLLELIRQYRLKVPEDISLVSFDDSYLATVTEVKLTSLKHSKVEMGVLAAEMLISKIENREMQWEKEILFKPELIVRDSTQKYKEPLIV